MDYHPDLQQDLALYQLQTVAVFQISGVSKGLYHKAGFGFSEISLALTLGFLALNVAQAVCIMLWFFATGCLLYSVGDAEGLSRNTVYPVVHQVASARSSSKHEFIFPYMWLCEQCHFHTLFMVFQASGSFLKGEIIFLHFPLDPF